MIPSHRGGWEALFRAWFPHIREAGRLFLDQQWNGNKEALGGLPYLPFLPYVHTVQQATVLTNSETGSREAWGEGGYLPGYTREAYTREIYLRVYLSGCTYPDIYFRVYLSGVHTRVYLRVYLSVCNRWCIPGVYLSVCNRWCIPGCVPLSVHNGVYPGVCLSVCTTVVYPGWEERCTQRWYTRVEKRGELCADSSPTLGEEENSAQTALHLRRGNPVAKSTLSSRVYFPFHCWLITPRPCGTVLSVAGLWAIITRFTVGQYSRFPSLIPVSLLVSSWATVNTVLNPDPVPPVPHKRWITENWAPTNLSRTVIPGTAITLPTPGILRVFQHLSDRN